MPKTADELGAKIILVSGHFNVLHPGHMRLLRFAKECGGKLVVAVESDRIAGSAAHVPEALRLEGIRSNSWVDEAFIFDESISSLIERLKPDIVVKGKEHESRKNIELDVLRVYGGKLIFSSGESLFSSLDLIKKEFRNEGNNFIGVPKVFMDRHDISAGRLKLLVERFRKLKICVIGDLIVDEYITCAPLGMSQEEATIVVTPIDSTKFIGGAGIVAAHAAGLGAKVDFISVAGADEAFEFARSELFEYGVELNLFTDDSRPTTLKQRYRSGGKSLLRVSHLHQAAISLQLQERVYQKFIDLLNEVDLVVFSDFNYGCLPQELVNRLSLAAKSKGILIAADSQSSSQIGDIGRFKGMDLITPTEREARISARNYEDGLVILAEKLRQQALAQNILLKLGAEGLLIHAESVANGGWITDRVEALNESPKDVSGAGDSLLITSAMTLAGGGSIWEAACLGSIAAAIQVGRVGNTPIRDIEIMREIQR